jgi:hypothetical protein
MDCWGKFKGFVLDLKELVLWKNNSFTLETML